MNKYRTLEIPAGMEPADGPFHFVLRHRDAGFLSERVRKLKNRFSIKGIKCSDGLENDSWFDLLEELRDDSFVMVEPPERAEFSEIIEKLSRRRSEVILRSSDKDLEKNVRYWAHSHFQIKIIPDRLDENTPEIFSNILDFYMHTPFIAKRIFPFHFLMDGFLNIRDVSLLDYYLGHKAGWFRVDEEKRVRFLFSSEKLPVLGGITGDFDEAEKNARDYSRRAYEKMAAEESVCLRCPYFRICGGFFLFFEKKETCAWPSFYETLEEEMELAREHFSKVRREKEDEPPKKDSTLFVSQECVNNCVFCAVADKRKNKLPDFSRRVWKALESITQEKVRQLSFSGAGETTLNPELPGLVEEAKKRGVEEIVVFTNGFGMTEEKMKILASKGVDGFLLSIHGLGDRHDKAVRRKGSFEDVLCFLECWDKHAPRIKLTVNTCLTIFSLNDIDGLADFTKKHNARRHSIVFPEWSGNVLNTPEYIPLYLQVRKALKKFHPDRYSHVVFDNIPRCMVPENMNLRFLRLKEMLIYDDISKRKEIPKDSTKLFNRKLQACGDIHCPRQDECSGFDREYLRHHGEAELAAFILEWKDYSKEHV